MAKKYPHSSRSLTRIRPDAPPAPTQEASYRATVARAVNQIDSVNGPTDPASGAPFFPEWQRLSFQERIRAVIDATDCTSGLGTSGPLGIRFEKDVRDGYEKKHRRNR